MPSYFVKREDPENAGQFIYEEVPADKVEIDPTVAEQVVFNHPKYREVVEESKGRKAKIRELRSELDKLDGVQDQPKEPVEPPKDAPPAPLNEDDLFAKFVTRLQAEQKAAEDKKVARETELRALVQKHNLGSDAMQILEMASDPAKTAQLLEKSAYRFDDQVGGSPAAPDKEALMGNILKNLGLDGEK